MGLQSIIYIGIIFIANAIIIFERMNSLKPGSLDSSAPSIDNSKKRTALKMVRSTFEPPQQTQSSYLDQIKTNSMHSLNKFKLSTKVQHQSPLDIANALPYGAYSDIHDQEFHANIEFIKSIRPIKEYSYFEEGDYFPILDSDDRWLIISGEVKVQGINGLSFNRRTGYIFFASTQTKTRIKQVIAVESTTAVRLPRQFFRDYIRNFLYVKNAQKIKFMKYSPFLVWNQSIAEDLAICMELQDNLPKDYQIYKAGQEAEDLYFVKEGIILLQRIGRPGNQVIVNYEKHYENSQLSEEEGLLIVRKGMIFGIDGILIKEKNEEFNLLQNNDLPFQKEKLDTLENPQQKMVRPYHQLPQVSPLKTVRIYSAKSIGKCELYKLNKKILQTYFKMSQYLSEHPEQLHMSKEQLQRICRQYTGLIMRDHDYQDKIKHSLKKKEFVFSYQPDEEDQADFKKKRNKVIQIKEHERKLKKISVQRNSVNKVDNNYQKDEEPTIIDKKSPGKTDKNLRKNISLPSLYEKSAATNKFSVAKKIEKMQKKNQIDKKIEGLISKKIQQKELNQYLTFKKKIEQTLLHREPEKASILKTKPNQEQYKKKKNNNLEFINVKSYRSILSSLG